MRPIPTARFALCHLALLSAVVLVTASRLALAATPSAGLSLTWNDCPGGATASHGVTYACASNSDTLQLVCSLVVQQSIGNVIGAELVLDIQHSDPTTMPDWWRFDGSGIMLGCRSGGFDTVYDFSTNPGCTDAWLGNAFGGNQGISIGPPDHPFANQARLKEVAAVTSTQAVTLSAGTTYGLLKVAINSNRTVSGPACTGCDGSACLVFNSVLIRVLPSAGSDVTISAPAAPESNWATWQGTAANCTLVPTRRSTWGAIKSLYR